MIRDSKRTDIICVTAAVLAVIIAAGMITGCLIFAKPEENSKAAFAFSDDYTRLIFDDSYVHEIDIRLPKANWDYMVRHATEEQYVFCSAVIDGEIIENVAIRPKGNSSLGAIKTQGSDRFSFKIEFDHYDASKSYHGLDKLALNNLGQDVSCMKDFLCYHFMNEMGVASPLSSYALMKVNGEDFGLYLAVEAIEHSFAQRCFGEDYGNLYKPECFAIEKVTPAAFINMDEDFFAKDFTKLTPGDRTDILGGAVKKPFENCFGEDMAAAAFKYVGEDPKKYNVFFDASVFDITKEDKASFINAVKRLNEGADASEVMDVDAVINYFVVHNFVNNYDSYTGIFVHNYYVYEKDGRLTMVPWDYNLAFGIFTFETVAKCIVGENSPYNVEFEVGNAMDDVTNMVNYPIDTPTISVDPEERPILYALLSDEKYMSLYHERYREFLENYFYSGRFEKSFNKTLEMITPYIERGLTFYEPSKAKRGAKAVYEYCELRAKSIQGQLDGKIPATMEGQRLDYENLVDASHVELSASVTFDSLLFGIRDTDFIEILDAVSGNYPHNTAGFNAAIEEMAADNKKIVEALMRVLTSSSLVKKALTALTAPFILFILSIITLIIAKNIAKNYKRRNGGENNAASP